MNKFIALLFILFTAGVNAQLVQWTPYFAKDTDSMTVIFDATQGNAGLSGYTGDVYAHTGVITNLSNNDKDWKYVKTPTWGTNTPETKLTRLGTNLYQFKIPNSVRAFYNVPAAETIKKIAFVFRSATSPYREGKTADGGDILVPLASAGFAVAVTVPNTFPVIITPNTSFPVEVQSALSTSLSLYIDGQLISTTSDFKINYTYVPATTGKKWIKAVASNGTTTKADSVAIVVRPLTPPEAALPAGAKDGINYNSNTSVTLVLFAPMKNFVYAMGDFSNWGIEPTYFMNRTPDGKRWWVTIDNLTAGTEYGFQYLVDGTLRIPDPYTDKVLDPWNDGELTGLIYPNLKAYPAGKTSNLVSVFQPGQTPYNWQATSYVRPAKEKLVIYELLLRDFSSTHVYRGLSDTIGYLKKLGVTAVELMPINEFDGNLSWGYNPALHGAVDKYYGPKNDLKQFIDKCHQNGIAVILDVVYNHAFGNSPLVRLYWDASVSKPAANSPYFNQDAKHPYNVGYDFNHESTATQDFMDNTLRAWLTEYKIDGFRFDLSKGFTQKYTGNDVGAWGVYELGRINLLKRMADKIWATTPGAYVILEHFADNSEEKELANYGMMLWGKMTSNYNEATMGYTDNNKSDISWISYKNRGWNSANLVGYMESHDEERLMYKNLMYGNASGSYNTKTLAVALERMKTAGAFFFLIPGPKMIWQFGELGYDITINYPCGTDACRTDKKPLKWEYYADYNRNRLYKTWGVLANLKKDYPAFSSSNFNMDVAGALKRINIYDNSMDVVVVGNFNVVSGSISGNFSRTGTWYDLFSGTQFNVSNTNDQINLAPGEFHVYTTVKLPTPEPGLVAVDNNRSAERPATFVLEQNYPNPFNPSTTITFGLPEAADVSVVVYNQLGEKIADVYNGYTTAGYHSIDWNASTLASGVYFYRLVSGNTNITRKLVVMK